MTPSFDKFAFSRTAAGVLFALALSGCGSLVDMGGNSTGNQRRVYVNDVANNDSLRSAILNGGVYFIMQPGKQYSLKVDSGVVGEYLQVLKASGSVYSFWKNVPGTLNGTQATYIVQDSTATSANYFLVYLRSPTGGAGTRPAKVRLVPANPTFPASVKVRLVMVRTLSPPTGGFSNAAAKTAFAHAFMAKLASVYKTQDIALDTSFEILEPDLPAFTADFNGTKALPTVTRQANTIYLFLVQRILNNGVANAEGEFLGFAPREAVSFATDEVVLSAWNGAVPASIAVTAAHEMGHLLGLRHTTATGLDKSGDDDLSNLDDGFTTTGLCTGLPKRMAGPAVLENIRMPGGRPYCLRIAADDPHCPSACTDINNLMFAYQCRDYTQDSLVSAQSIFIRQNLSLFQN